MRRVTPHHFTSRVPPPSGESASWTLRSLLASRGLDDNYMYFLGLINSVAIPMLNQIFKRVAVRLTDWEMHRTMSEYNNSIAMKLFLFQFVNSYTSLFFIAFWDRSFDQLQYQVQRGRPH